MLVGIRYFESIALKLGKYMLIMCNRSVFPIIILFSQQAEINTKNCVNQGLHIPNIAGIESSAVGFANLFNGLCGCLT